MQFKQIYVQKVKMNLKPIKPQLRPALRFWAFDSPQASDQPTAAHDMLKTLGIPQSSGKLVLYISVYVENPVTRIVRHEIFRLIRHQCIKKYKNESQTPKSQNKSSLNIL